MEDKNSCLMVIVLLLLSIPIIILEGFLFSIYWKWFIVPLGVMPISVAHGVGLSVMLASLRVKVDGEKKSDKENIVKVLASLAAAIMIFCFAFVAHLCM